MAQHFLLSSIAKTLSLTAVARMSEDEARNTFKALRWASNGGEPFCPRCGCVNVYTYTTLPAWKCKACHYRFSVTAGTIFQDRKRPVRDYLLAIAIFANGAKGHSALQLSRDLACSYKAAFVLVHKIREALALDNAEIELAGTVEIDGAYFGGHSKPENKKEERKDRRLAEAQTGKRQVVVVARERAGKTLSFVVRSESAAVALIRQRVASGTVVHADEASGWDVLHASYDMKRVNHSIEYKSADDACTNQAESFFSRLRRSEIGIHHRISGPYLAAYASEMGWREDHRRVSNGALYHRATDAALAHPVSRQWSRYWQRAQKAV